MSILETFYVLFKSDASDLKKGADDAKKTTDKLNDSLNSTAKASNKIGASFVDMAKQFAGLVTAAVSVGAVLGGIKSAIDYSVELSNVSRLLGVNVEQLDAYGNAVQKYGGTAAGFQSSLKGLASHIGSTPAVALQLLPQLADSFSKMGRARAFQYGRMFGLDDATILMLQHGRREVEAQIARQKELGVVTKQNAEVAQKYNSSLQDVTHSFRTLFMELGLSVLPAFTKFFDVVSIGVQYLSEHIDLVKGGLIAIGLAAAVMAAPFVIANAAIIGLTAAVAGLIAVFALAYEDIRAFLEGHNSLIGHIVKKWPEVGKVAHEALQLVKDDVNDILQPLELIISAFEKVGNFFKSGAKSFTADLRAGQGLLGTAGANYFNSQTSSSIFGGNTLAPNRSITTGDINIITQATDADGIAAGFKESLYQHLGQANSNFDNGVVA